MTPTKVLVGEVLLVFAIVIATLWYATQWAAAQLGYQPELGTPWLSLASLPIYYPWRLFEWWYAFDAYAPALFNEAGTIAALETSFADLHFFTLKLARDSYHGHDDIGGLRGIDRCRLRLKVYLGPHQAG